TESFVMPIMYKYRLGALEAWRYFMPWLRAAGIYFFLYGLFVLALFVLTAVAVVILGLATCCIGIIVMMIPYINTLVLLPLHVTYRALSLEFLAQFDPRFDLFAPPAPVPAEPVAP
ncbi:MAG: hypothetical protein MUF51_10680, partial [Vicinamibacteria bacterium]|nr:hypothetical protein [Vicinamibacteria bacterium]